jgi:hypothetical protein
MTQMIFKKNYFSSSEVALICLVGILQILASVSVIINYGLGGKFVPGFSGIYPSLGSCAVILKPTLATILAGLSLGYLLQIAHNGQHIRRFWGSHQTNEEASLIRNQNDEILMTIQYFLLSLSGLLQRILFSITPILSISLYATAEKVAQNGGALLTAGFNQHFFNEKIVIGSEHKIDNLGKVGRESRYFALIFFVLALFIYFQRQFLALLFEIVGVESGKIDELIFYLRPMTLGIAFFSVGSLITTRFYSLGRIRLCAKTGIFNALASSIALSILFITNKLHYTAIALLALAAINTFVKLVQWNLYISSTKNRAMSSTPNREIKIIIAGLSLLSLLTVLTR